MPSHYREWVFLSSGLGMTYGPAAEANRAAWRQLERWEKPFLTLFSDADPITRGADRRLQERIPGSRGQPHALLHAGHFIQEDQGGELAERLIQFLA